jgi:hypothetical protein
MPNGKRLMTVHKRPVADLSDRRACLSMAMLSTWETSCARSVRVMPKEVVHDFPCRAIPAHSGVDLGIKWTACGLSKSKRRKDRNGFASLQDPNYRDVPDARRRPFDRLKADARLHRRVKP